MISMIIYLVKVAIYVTAFYFIYTFLLRKDTSHGRNRIFILISLVASIFLPSLTLSTGKPLEIQAFGRLLSEVFVTPGRVISDFQEQKGPSNTVYTIYITGVIIFIFKLIADFSSLLFLILKQKNGSSRIIKFHDFNTAGFSAMGFIFINSRLSPDEAEDVIRHERNHLRENHYIDIIFIEFMTAFQWFNPFIHFINRELRAIHEFQADQGCLKSGIPVINYQSLLVSQIFRSGSLRLSNSFSNPSLIRKRLIMMTKEKTSQLANLKLLSVIPVAGIVFLSLSAEPLSVTAAPVQIAGNDGVPYVVVEEMPYYPGGDRAILQYISDNVIYPDEVKNQNIEGTVIVRFCITSEGRINQVSVLKRVNPALDAEAIRVVQSLPSFAPGRKRGVPVPVWYIVPIIFARN